MCDTLLGYNVLPLWKFLKNNQLEDKRFPQNRKPKTENKEFKKTEKQ
jgi:hypothetical protein